MMQFELMGGPVAREIYAQTFPLYCFSLPPRHHYSENLKNIYLFSQVGKIASIICLIWLLSVVAILPTTYSTGIIGVKFTGTPLIMSNVCVETWPFPSLHLIYSILLMFVQVSKRFKKYEQGFCSFIALGWWHFLHFAWRNKHCRRTRRKE